MKPIISYCCKKFLTSGREYKIISEEPSARAHYVMQEDKERCRIDSNQELWAWVNYFDQFN